ncbi:SDR family NAD(P)-dependent oxidoreductase [Nonomuraea sp. ATR24]|uniref:SDR family NAD(P)-dependent oxidoreductase n=1 Tax=Nonomuraea TaxID=83681 RepID=UPI001C5E13FB|nr:SDR family oxidoreductase [Nonomuraea ceibae]
MELSGTTALITGASGGLGQAIAHALARHGVRVILTGRDTAVLTALAGRLGGRAIAADLTDHDGLTALMRQAGPVDILVANAGVIAPAAITDHTTGDIDTYLALNLRAPIVMARTAAEHMIANGRGHIVLMSSLGGKISHARCALYNATKYGLRGFGHAARADLAPHGVGVSVICPGLIRNAGMLTRAPAPLPSWIAAIGTRTPQQVARAVCRAIRTNAAEADVAPLLIRLVAHLGGLSPALGAHLQRLGRADSYADTVARSLAATGAPRFL